MIDRFENAGFRGNSNHHRRLGTLPEEVALPNPYSILFLSAMVSILKFKLVYAVILNQINLFFRSHSSTIFMISTPKHVCKVSQLANFPIDFQIYISNPSAIKAEEEEKRKKTSLCHKLDIDYDDYLRELNLPENTTDPEVVKTAVKDYFDSTGREESYMECDEWTYDNTDYDETAVTKVRN